MKNTVNMDKLKQAILEFSKQDASLPPDKDQAKRIIAALFVTKES